MTHLCISKLSSIASDNGLSPGRRQSIIWTNAGILLIGPLGTNFNEILSKIHTFSFKKMRLKMSSGKWRPFGLGLNVLNVCVVKLFTLCLVHVINKWHIYCPTNIQYYGRNDIPSKPNVCKVTTTYPISWSLWTIAYIFSLNWWLSVN